MRILYEDSLQSDTFMEILWKNSLKVVLDFYGENMVNLITIQRLDEDSLQSDTFMEILWKNCLKIVSGFFWENMVNLITRHLVWRLYGHSVESDTF